MNSDGARGQLARRIAEGIVKLRCCQVARGESERQKEKEIVGLLPKQEEEEREKKPTTPAPVYLKSIKGYHHKTFCVSVAHQWKSAYLLLFSFPPNPLLFCQSIPFASSQ
jgi:hypothetical protein